MKMKVTPAPEATGKIVTPYAKIFRSPSKNGDCWSIRYLDPTDGEIHIGFSSFVRDNVEHWLKEEFEVYDCRDKITDIDAELGKALRKVAEILMQKYPEAVCATIKLDSGKADIDIAQKSFCDYGRCK